MKKLFSLLFIAVLSLAINNSAFSQNVNVTPNPATYPTVGAAFTAINAGLHGAGAVAVSIKGNTTEGASAILNGGVFTSCSITPVGPRTVTGNFNLAVIDLNGADNVTIDGLNTGGNSLTVINPNAGTGANGVQCSNGASNNTFRNVTAVGAGAVGGTAGGRGFNIGQSTALTSGNNDNTIESCMTNGFRRGVQTFGTAGVFINERTIVRGCIVKNFTSLGIFIGSETKDCLVEMNQVFHDAPVSNDVSAGGSRAINVQGLGLQVVRRNTVRSLMGTLAGNFIGIISIPVAYTAPIVSPPTKVEVYNNMVALDNTLAASLSITGIFHGTIAAQVYTLNTYYNSTRIGGSSGATVGAQSIGLQEALLNAGDTARIYNNISINDRSGGDATTLHIGTDLNPAAGVSLEADFNVAHATDTSARGWDAAYRGTLYRNFGGMELYHDSTCAANIEQSTVFMNVTFVSPTDLHLVASAIGGNLDALTSIPKDVSTDFDGESRAISTSNCFTYRGADEILALGSKKCKKVYWKTESSIGFPYVVYILLRESAAPYAVKEIIVKEVREYLSGIIACTDVYTGPFVGSGSYYLEVRTKHTIRTQSSNPVSFAPDISSYDFTTSLSQAFGNNMAGTSPPFSIYNGDVNQDDIVDGTDAAAVDNDAFNFRSGCYIRTDVNSDGIVDGSDAAIIDNNAANFVQAVLLPGTAPRPSEENTDNSIVPVSKQKPVIISRQSNIGAGN